MLEKGGHLGRSSTYSESNVSFLKREGKREEI